MNFTFEGHPLERHRGEARIAEQQGRAMVALYHPVFSLPYPRYVVLWSVIGLLGLGVFLSLVLPAYRGAD